MLSVATPAKQAAAILKSNFLLFIASSSGALFSARSTTSISAGTEISPNAGTASLRVERATQQL
jgi:hypothetical protein